jgi:hypothetical protein
MAAPLREPRKTGRPPLDDHDPSVNVSIKLPV